MAPAAATSSSSYCPASGSDMQQVLRRNAAQGGVFFFGKPGCPYCDRLKAALDGLAVPYRGILVTEPRHSAQLKQLTGMKTYPMLYFGDELVGGFDAFNTLALSNQLPARLVRAGVLFSEDWF